MFPSIFSSQMHQQQTKLFNDLGNHYVINNQSQHLTEYHQYQPSHFPGYQPFSITISNNSHYYQQPTVISGSSDENGSSFANVKPEVIDQQNDIAATAQRALHLSSNTSVGNDQSNKNCSITTSEQISQQAQQVYQSNRSPLGELRLPSIRTSANMAANVMSEETDLGYCSFSDISNLQEISDTMNYSDVSDDIFDDVKSNFSDIIDDVLDNIDNSDFTKYEAITPPLEAAQENRVKTPKLDPYTGMYEEFVKQESVESKENHYEQVPIQNVTVFTGFVPYFIPANVHTNIDNSQSSADAYCQICDKYFQTKSSLRVHMRQHRGERPHHCPYCQKSFTQKSTLRTHIRTHTGERPYSCQFCARAFSDYSTYRKHVRVHTGEKPYTCDICKKSFTQSGNMIRHREVHFKKSDDKQKQTVY